MIKFHNITPDLHVAPKLALIGNSNCLLTRKQGSLIDTFDTVIRFNYGDLNKDTTGLKTDIRWINCPITVESAKEHNKSVTSETALKIYTDKLLTGTKVICWDSLQQKLNKDLDFYTPNELCTLPNINSYLAELNIKHRFTVVDNCWPRTGFQAVLTCIKSGIKPHLFGFDTTHNRIIKHYSLTTNYSVAHMTQHQVDNEIDILQELKQKGLIILH
jgi:hypothetical protein